MKANLTAGRSPSASTSLSNSVIADAQSDFATAMAALGLDQHNTYLTALSGGADSTALAILVQHYATAAGKQHHTVIVDHGLRDHAHDEACRVKDRLHAHGVASEIISVDGPRPRSGLQEWARLHRHNILMSIARDRQAALLFAHHADDQAETIAMRLLKGSGLAGLAGIPAVRAQHGVTIARPVLGWSRDQLLLICSHYGCSFELDLSNKDRQFERVRIRQLLASLDQGGDGPSSCQMRRLGMVAAQLSTQATNANARPLSKAVDWHYAGFATVMRENLANLPEFRWVLAMRRLVMAISGGGYAPSAAAMNKLRNRINAGLSATIGGCHFSPIQMKQGRPSNDRKIALVYRLFRETGRHLSTMSIGAGDEVVFAGCWLVISQQAGTLHALGDAGKIGDDLHHTLIDKNMPDDWHLMPHRARQAIPVLTTLDGEMIYPQLKGYDNRKRVAPLVARFLGMAQNPMFLAETSTSVPC